MFLSMYRFDGDPDVLLAAFDRLHAMVPDTSDLRVCVVRPNGILMLDTCPSREVFEIFSTSEGFARALADVGLPTPTIEPLGDVHLAHLKRPSQDATGSDR
jgi:hypothetical protein